MSGETLEREISEQPDVIRRLIEDGTGPMQELAARLRGKFRHVVIAARGTSDNAARYAKYLFGAHNQIQVALATPSLFTLYHQPPQMEGMLVMGISQSGRPPDIVSVVEEARRQRQPTLALTNDPQSPLAEAAEHVITIEAGEEKAVAATKTYTASLAALALFSACLNQDDQALAQIGRLPEQIAATLEINAPLAGRAERYRYMEHVVVIGRGFNYATAFEISLKIAELTQTIAEPYSSADFMHGPIALIHRGFPVLLIAPHGSVFENLQKLVGRLDELGSELMTISEDEGLQARSHLAMPLPVGIPEWLSPLVAVLPGQLFCLSLARARGLDPDQPPGLTKVTETW
jgi:glucosamine--fructose-6-phosphate aminotransferase (isomerizing)